MSNYVKEKWKQLTSFSRKEELKEQLWEEIDYFYAAPHRHYHNLNHIAYLFTLCDEYIDRIKNPAVMGFAILYHDIIYDTYRTDNEAQSANLAATHLNKLGINPALITSVQNFIIATRNHEIVPGIPHQEDMALFLDFDMAILAADKDSYNWYSEKIRLEYAKYPDELYKEGRRHALQKILAAENIFVSADFRWRMEAAARNNILQEVSLL